MRLSTHVTSRAGLKLAMALCVAAYAVCLSLPGEVINPVLHGALGMATVWLPPAVCWLAVSRVGFRRREVVLAAMAVTSYAAGDTYYVLTLAADLTAPFPSPADVGYLSFAVLMLASLVAEVRYDIRVRAWSVWLDCAVGSLGAAGVLAVLLNPVLTSALAGSWSLATAVAVAYPMFDLVLVAAVIGIAALRGARVGGRWVLLVAGLLAYAVADVAYALQVTAGTYSIDSPLNAGWVIALALLAIWVDSAAPLDESVQEARPATGSAALLVSSVATAAGLGVLVFSSRTHLSTLAVVLAAVTLVAAAARTQLAFRQLVRMADLRRQATTDHLTGLPNRRALYLEADVRLAKSEQRCQALLMLDLDRFKEVNDSLGHHKGDQLLIHVGDRLGERVGAADLLVRLGGDEFAVLLDGADHDRAAAMAVKLCAALSEPFVLDDVAVHSAVSIGIALFPGDGPDLDTLLRKADVAMYKAKAVGGDGHHAYGGGDENDFATRLRMVQELRTALSGEELVVHYQPKVDLRTGAVHGVEALVRWEHPTRGLLQPDGFLDLVEESGLMRAMTNVVLEIALDQAVEWRAAGRRLTIAVNLSASSLVDNELPERVAAMLDARSLPHGALQLEITEEFLMADRDRARNILTRLRHGGVEISVDDFGTGYSSLSYLRDLPIDELKLDRSFILPMVDDARAAALVASTIALAHSLDLRMVAEGVETDAAFTELARLGCDQAQGYCISRPVPAAELDHWLTHRPVSDGLTEVPQLQPAGGT